MEEQLQGGPSHDPRRGDDHDTIVQRETALVENFEKSATPHTPSRESSLSPSEALRLKHQHLHSISVLALQFGAKIVDVSEYSVIVEMAGKTSRVEAFLNLIKPFGVLESARTGMKHWSHFILVLN